jgi:hypothetical protein
MPTLPAATDLTGATITEAQLKTALVAVRDYIATLLGTAGTQAAALTAIGALLNGFTAKTGAYTIVSTDRGKLVTCSGTWTLALNAAGTLGAGFACAVTNIGTGTITIDPSAAQTIDGALTLNLAPGESCILFCTGSVWHTVGRTKSPAGLAFADEYNNSTPGAWSVTAPAGATSAAVTVIGASGGDGYGGGDLCNKGGSGGYSFEVFTVTPGMVLSGVVGSGGQHDTAGWWVNAPSGGASTCTQTGQTCNGGQGGLNSYYGIYGGSGGSASGGTINTAGATGAVQQPNGYTYGQIGYAAPGSIHIQWRT